MFIRQIAYENNFQKPTNEIAEQKSNQQTNIQENRPTDQPGPQNWIFLCITKKWDVCIFLLKFCMGMENT